MEKKTAQVFFFMLRISFHARPVLSLPMVRATARIVTEVSQRPVCYHKPERSPMSNTILWIILGYLSGCILYSQLACQLFQVPDITKLSPDGNPGVFNAFQNGGFAVGLFTLAGDLLKGALPLFLWRMTTPGWKENTLLPLVMAAPVMGTLWPAFRHFSGGKGITVSFSVLLGLVPDWRPVLLLAACFLFFSLILVVDSHYYRTLVAFTAFPAGACLSGLPPMLTAGCLLLSLCVLTNLALKHREAGILEVHLLWKH